MTTTPLRRFRLACLAIGAAIVLSAPTQASEILTTASYDSPDGYDFVDTTPPSGPIIIGTYSFTPFTATELGTISSITISGSFGNLDNPTTALSDYYLGFAGNETAVPVVGCDSTMMNPSPDCTSGTEGPYDWTTTLTSLQIADLATGLEAGALDFTYTWDSNPPVDGFFPGTYLDQYVYAGATQLDITQTPEPTTIVFCLGGFAGVLLRRRFRKV